MYRKLMKHKTDKEYSNAGLKTALQWSKEGKLPNQNAGIELWCNPHHQNRAIYYGPDEVHDASGDEMDNFLSPLRKRRRETYMKRKEREKKER